MVISFEDSNHLQAVVYLEVAERAIREAAAVCQGSPNSTEVLLEIVELGRQVGRLSYRLKYQSGLHVPEEE